VTSYNTIDAMWQEYRTRTLREASPEVTRLMKRAFYSGAAATLNIVLTMDRQVSAAAAAGVLNGLVDECKSFGRAMGKGRA
jgi:hypothetical protein